MPALDRRSFVRAGIGATVASALPPAIARAVAIAPDRRSGTIKDVAHVVILMQENRGFDHYFGSLRGVRGFADRFPIPIVSAAGEAARNVWQQHDRSSNGGPATVGPFHLATRSDFELMRMAGTPHTWPDAQQAWDQGRMAHWPEAKQRRSMGHFRREDMPFQYALAEAFTLCDAYHCSMQTGTNTNRLFLWSGTNDPGGHAGGPAIANSHDLFPEKGGAAEPYRWTTVVERLQKAGVDWRIYQDMADNFSDNPLVGFQAFREAHAGRGNPVLKDRALTTQALDVLRSDILTGKLPQVSYIIATAEGSEHPGPSSPAQGAAYTADVLDALTANPAVWARTALFVMFDENDGFFDHMPPPAPPTRGETGEMLGGSTVTLDGEYHLVPSRGDAAVDKSEYRGRSYGLGPRVPMYVVSPWSRGGWVNSQVFDHTSVIRFLENRFGFHEPNISPWRRVVCGDLTSAFDFGASNAEMPDMPDPHDDARKAAAVPRQVKPNGPADFSPPWQEPGIRRSRPLPYRLEVSAKSDERGMKLRFSAAGAGAVFHVYDLNALDRPPRRYTVAAGRTLNGRWPFDPEKGYDLWVLGPNGFHRHFTGDARDPRDRLTDAALGWKLADDTLLITVGDGMPVPVTVTRQQPARASPIVDTVTDGILRLPLAPTMGWYDVTITSAKLPAFRRRMAGRVDRLGSATTSDPFVANIDQTNSD